eukprot:2860876-Amphidinium_carterae.1
MSVQTADGAFRRVPAPPKGMHLCSFMLGVRACLVEVLAIAWHRVQFIVARGAWCIDMCSTLPCSGRSELSGLKGSDMNWRLDRVFRIGLCALHG